MFLNNIKALIIQLIIAFIVLMTGKFFSMFELMQKIIYGNIVGKIIYTLFVILLYVFLSQILSKKYKRYGDFFVGSYIVLIGIVFIVIALAGSGFDLFKGEIGGNLWRFPMDFLTLPVNMCLTMWGSDMQILNIVLSLFVPGIIMGLCLRLRRGSRGRKR